MKIYLDTIGCRLNQSEIEKIGEQFRAAGHTLVDSLAQADLAVINTCTVTAKAAADSRKKIRQAYRGGAKEILVTGCWATLETHTALELPGVAQVVSNAEKDSLVCGYLGLPAEALRLDRLARKPLPGNHQRTRAFIKAQDGCDNSCTYCLTRLARGPSRSVPLEQIGVDLRRAEEGGVKEVVLTGVHLASWGMDLTPPASIKALVEYVLENTRIPRLRLSSLEPWDLTPDFFSLWQNDCLCPHLHIPLQSGSGKTLHRMGRKITPSEYAGLLDQARSIQPDIAITTDVIVGFPGETESDFEESLAFVERMNFAGGHVFAYSPRPGTPAEKFPDRVSPEVIKVRSMQMRQAFRRSAQIYQEKFIGREVSVLWESKNSQCRDGWILHGLTENYLQVTAFSPEPICNEISQVKLVEILEDGIRAVILL